MLVMVSNCTSWRTHYLQGKYGGLGLLLPPDGLRGPYPHLPFYAIDNGAFPAWSNKIAWDADKFRRALDWAAYRPIKPKWVVVPDVVTKAQETFESWHKWKDEVAGYGYPLAFAVQDGMALDDLRKNDIHPDVVFIGGSTEWKMRTLKGWCREFPRVHVGRINGLRGLLECHEHGAESCDGTGWFRGSHTQLDGLITYLREHGEGPVQHRMFFPQPEGHPELFDSY
jgi:hypothetical protein